MSEHDFRVVKADDPDEIHLSTALTLKEMTREILIYTLASCGWSQKKAARKLGLTARQMHYAVHTAHRIELPRSAEGRR